MPEQRVQAQEYYGVGIYALSEAARLTGVSASRIRRWVRGYTFKAAGASRHSAPVWRSQLPRVDNHIAVGFLDLLEIRFVNAFLDYGVSWPTIRKVEALASKLFKTDHPFATRRFRTDGRRIFARLSNVEGDALLLDIADSQFAFDKVISPYLVGVEFSAGAAVRWWPLGEKRHVVIDPQRCFGQPIVWREGVPTIVLATAFAAEKSAEAVARHYEVATQSVRDAVEFEKKLAA